MKNVVEDQWSNPPGPAHSCSYRKGNDSLGIIRHIIYSKPVLTIVKAQKILNVEPPSIEECLDSIKKQM